MCRCSSVLVQYTSVRRRDDTSFSKGNISCVKPNARSTPLARSDTSRRASYNQTSPKQPENKYTCIQQHLTERRQRNKPHVQQHLTEHRQQNKPHTRRETLLKTRSSVVSSAATGETKNNYVVVCRMLTFPILEFNE